MPKRNCNTERAQVCHKNGQIQATMALNIRRCVDNLHQINIYARKGRGGAVMQLNDAAK